MIVLLLLLFHFICSRPDPLYKVLNVYKVLIHYMK